MENRSEAYWNSYRLLENQLIKLSHSISFDDNQINVYSSELADIINSACIKIESLAKDIYEEHIYPFQLDSNTIPQTIQNNKRINKSKFRIEKWGRKDWHFDYNCLVEIDLKYALSKKVVRLKSERFHFKKYQDRLLPFGNITLNDCNGGKWELYQHIVFGYEGNAFDDINWCKSYQAIKHNYIQSIPEHGTIKNAIMVMSAFYLLSVFVSFLPAKKIWDYHSDNFELDFDSQLFTCKIERKTPDFIFDSEETKQMESEIKAQENHLYSEYFRQRRVFETPDASIFASVIKEFYYDDIKKLVEDYCQKYGVDKFDISPYANEKTSQTSTEGYILYQNLKKYIFAPYNSNLFYITLNTGANLYENCYIHDYDYERLKHKSRIKNVLASLQVGDYVNVRFILNDEFSNCKVEELDENRITISVKNDSSTPPKINRYIAPIQNILYISKV